MSDFINSDVFFEFDVEFWFMVVVFGEWVIRSRSSCELDEYKLVSELMLSGLLD